MRVTESTLILLATLAIATVSVRAVCPKSSPSECVDEAKFNDLRQSNPNSYCQQGAILYGEAKKCLQLCSSKEKEDFLNNKKAEIDAFCSSRFNNCTSVTDKCLEQLGCFDFYGGEDHVINEIFEAFEKKEERIDCNYLYWGRYCQRTQACEINRAIEPYLVQRKPLLVLALAVCGSETADDLANDVLVSDKCTGNTYKNIEEQCNIGCEIADAKESSDVCAAFEKQSVCIERLSEGCRTAEERYAVPRFDTYAIANKYLGCSIKYNGLLVQAPAASQCDYTDLLNSCFYARAIEVALNFDRLLPLFNMDMPVGEFCQNSDNETQLVAKCTEKYLACQTPQAKIFGKLDLKDKDIGEKAGAFPLNIYGLDIILNWLKTGAKCKKDVRWSEQICEITPSTTKPSTSKPTTTTTTTIPTTTTARKAIGTPPPKKTDSPASTQGKPPGTPVPRTPKPIVPIDVPKEDDKSESGNVQAQTNSSDRLALSSLMLLFTSIMVTLYQQYW